MSAQPPAEVAKELVAEWESVYRPPNLKAFNARIALIERITTAILTAEVNRTALIREAVEALPTHIAPTRMFKADALAAIDRVANGGQTR